MAHARIGKIRLKAGGAEVRVLRNVAADPADNLRGKIIGHAKMIADMGKPGSELVGFITIGLFADGKSTVGCRFDPNSSPIPKSLIPSWAAEILRRDLITSAEAEEVACTVVNRANGFVD